MKKVDYYNSASSHFVSRFKMRDNILLLYLAAVGAIYGVAFGEPNEFTVLLIIPFLALGSSLLIVHHNVMLGALLTYLKHTSKSKTSKIRSFENSKFLFKRFSLALGLRTLGQLIILFLPSIMALILNPIKGLENDNLLWLWWIIGLSCTIIGFILIILIHLKQRHLKR